MDVDLVTSFQMCAHRCALNKWFWRQWTPTTWFFARFGQKFFCHRVKGDPCIFLVLSFGERVPNLKHLCRVKMCAHRCALNRLTWRHWTQNTWFFTGLDQKFFLYATEWKVNLVSSWSYLLVSGVPTWNTCVVTYFDIEYGWLKGSVKYSISPVGETFM